MSDHPKGIGSLIGTNLWKLAIYGATKARKIELGCPLSSLENSSRQGLLQEGRRTRRRLVELGLRVKAK